MGVEGVMVDGWTKTWDEFLRDSRERNGAEYGVMDVSGCMNIARLTVIFI